MRNLNSLLVSVANVAMIAENLHRIGRSVKASARLRSFSNLLRQRTVLMTVFSLVLVTIASGQKTSWNGQWVTDRGMMTLRHSGNKVSGTYAEQGTIDGTVKANQLSLTFKNGRVSGSATFEMDEDGVFSGTYKEPQGSGSWRGWRKDPKAESKETADFSGVWLSNYGTIQLEQNQDQASGIYGAQGWATLEGQVAGSRFNLNWKRMRWSGTGWLELSADGKRIFGAKDVDGKAPSVWIGIRLEGFEHHAPPKAGEIVEGRADNGMLYFLRMPDDWKEGDKTDLVILLHGSNWTTKGMVWVTAKNWPDIGKKFAILGIQGESWAKWSDMDDLRFNYTYINWVGRSKLGGFPFTDRESPFLVANVIDELSKLHNFDRVFVGGHSQGGYLTHVMHMHYPEKLAGTFPIAGGMIIQSEPDVFDDEELMKAQRNTPMAMIHGKQDQVVGFSTGEYIYDRLLSNDFHRVKFFQPNMGHGYDFLPVGDAIRWLDVMSTTDASKLEKFAYEQADKGNWRDVGIAVARAQEIGGGQPFSKVWNMREDAAEMEANRFLQVIKSNRNSKWVDEFLKWQEQFSMTQASEPAVQEFNKLCEQHNEKAEELMNEVQKLFRSGNRNAAYAKYQEIVDQYYASQHYRTAKRQLAKRK